MRTPSKGHTAVRAVEKQPRRQRHSVGIQWRLWGYLSLFVAFILAVLWLFQIQLLDRFYEQRRAGELRKTAQSIALALGDDAAVEEEVYRCAMDYSICVQVFRLQSNRARILASADVSNDCIIHHVTVDYLATLYQHALDGGGIYAGKVRLGAGGLEWLDSGREFPKDVPDESASEQRQEEDRAEELYGHTVSALYIQSLQTEDGQEYIIMLDAALTPMSATVSTLRTQFWWIAALLLLGALLLAYLISRRVSRPLIQMNEAAKDLAQGKYDTAFLGNGYRETRELAQTLNFAAGELSKTDRLQKELIANVSHDLRTPLTMIRGYGELMRDLPGENTPENAQLIIDEVEHLNRLVGDMLDLSRLQAGTRTLVREQFDLTEMVRGVMARYEKLSAREGYRISLEAAEQVMIDADRTMMLQVVYNLINNAIHYAGEDRRVEIVQAFEQGRVRLAVRDHGVGIAQEELPLIWERYYKVDHVHRRAAVGTGLGLSIVKQVLELHGIAYGVQSRVGEGSTFWFELPGVRCGTPKKNEEIKEKENDSEKNDG